MSNETLATFMVRQDPSLDDNLRVMLFTHLYQTYHCNIRMKTFRCSQPMRTLDGSFHECVPGPAETCIMMRFPKEMSVAELKDIQDKLALVGVTTLFICSPRTWG